MDASQYKDYILTLLFIKYISDLHKAGRRSLIVVPRGASFDDMYAIRHEDDLGDKMNKMVEKITSANAGIGNINVADFDDGNKLGDAREKKRNLPDYLLSSAVRSWILHPTVSMGTIFWATPTST